MSTRVNDVVMEDFTALTSTIEREWDLVTDILKPTVSHQSTTIASIDRVSEKTRAVGDTRRDAERNKSTSENVITRHFDIPFFPKDDSMLPSDRQNLRRWGTENQLQTAQENMVRMLTRVKRDQNATKVVATYEAIRGTNYAPNGTVQNYDYAAEFQVTADVLTGSTINFGGTSVKSQLEAVKRHIVQKAEDGSSGYNVVVFCGFEYFDKMIESSAIEVPYTFASHAANPLVQRLDKSGMGDKELGRAFKFQGTLFIEELGSFNGVPLVPDNTAYFMPTDVDMFETVYAPANTIEAMNSGEQASELYVYMKTDHRSMKLETESSFIIVNKRPELVVAQTAA